MNTNSTSNKGGIVIHVDLDTILIKNVLKKSINWQYVSIVVVKDILPDSVKRIRKGFIGKEVHALAVDLLDIF